MTDLKEKGEKKRDFTYWDLVNVKSGRIESKRQEYEKIDFLVRSEAEIETKIKKASASVQGEKNLDERMARQEFVKVYLFRDMKLKKWVALNPLREGQLYNYDRLNADNPYLKKCHLLPAAVVLDLLDAQLDTTLAYSSTF